MPSPVKTMELKPKQLEIRHQIPGRIRLHVPALRDDPQLSKCLMRALTQIEGVRGVRWNPACSSLVVWHRRAGPLTQAELDQVLYPVLHRAAARRPAQIESSRAAPEALKIRTALAKRLPSPARAQSLVETTANWRSRLVRPTSWRLPLPMRLSIARKVATTPATKPVCWLCQLKLTLARWIFADIWRCWMNELTMQRTQAR
ncbi:MAG: HMA2 domain-containing protein [Thermochromatium sp.]